MLWALVMANGMGVESCVGFAYIPRTTYYGLHYCALHYCALHSHTDPIYYLPAAVSPSLCTTDPIYYVVIALHRLRLLHWRSKPAS